MREVLSALLEEGVLEDLEGGTNGAPKLCADQISQLQQFQELATPNREDLSKGSFDKQVAASAEHLVNLAEKKVIFLWLCINVIILLRLDASCCWHHISGVSPAH